MKVRVPTPLYSYTGNQSVVNADGATLELVTRDLDRQFMGFRFRIIDEQDQIRPHIKFFINGNQVFDLNEAVSSSDEVIIIQAFSGG